MDIVEHEHILLGVHIVEFVPLGGSSGHDSKMMLLGKCVVEEEVVVPEVGE